MKDKWEKMRKSVISFPLAKVIVLPTAQPIERTPNISENEIKHNADDVGTSDTCGTYKCVQ